MFIAEALTELVPDAKWTIESNDYSTLQWKSPDIAIPSQQELQAKIAEIAIREKSAAPLRLLRRQRDQLLQETDWWAVSDRVMSSEQLAYRQALRDLPSISTPVLDSSSPTGISGVVWPIKPE